MDFLKEFVVDFNGLMNEFKFRSHPTKLTKIPLRYLTNACVKQT